MTPEEELTKIKSLIKREKRDMLFFLAGFVVAFAMVGFSYIGRW